MFKKANKKAARSLSRASTTTSTKTVKGSPRPKSLAPGASKEAVAEKSQLAPTTVLPMASGQGNKLEARANIHLGQDQINLIKKALLSEKEKLLQKDRSLEQFCLDKNELSDVLDEASINIQASQELRFRNRETFYLKKINKGLDRILRGTYGLCEDCDGQISFERLLARPTAELCITCKEETELSERSNYYHGRSKSLGKAMHEMAGR